MLEVLFFSAHSPASPPAFPVRAGQEICPFSRSRMFFPSPYGAASLIFRLGSRSPWSPSTLSWGFQRSLGFFPASEKSALPSATLRLGIFSPLVSFSFSSRMKQTFQMGVPIRTGFPFPLPLFMETLPVPSCIYYFPPIILFLPFGVFFFS